MFVKLKSVTLLEIKASFILYFYYFYNTTRYYLRKINNNVNILVMIPQWHNRLLLIVVDGQVPQSYVTSIKLYLMQAHMLIAHVTGKRKI